MRAIRKPVDTILRPKAAGVRHGERVRQEPDDILRRPAGQAPQLVQDERRQQAAGALLGRARALWLPRPSVGDGAQFDGEVREEGAALGENGQVGQVDAAGQPAVRLVEELETLDGRPCCR